MSHLSCSGVPTGVCGLQYGWGVAAIITPTVLLITGVAFFGLVLGSGPLTPTLASIGLTPLMAAVLVRQGCWSTTLVLLHKQLTSGLRVWIRTCANT